MAVAAIAIGSNLGDRLGHIRAGALSASALETTRWLASSSVIETAAVVPSGAAAGPDYLNAVVLLDTDLEPHALLRSLLEIERRHGRDRSSESRWAARTLDLDLLLVADRVIDSADLKLPHPRMHERLFVLRPLVEVMPDWVHPVAGVSARRMLESAQDGGGPCLFSGRP